MADLLELYHRLYRLTRRQVESTERNEFGEVVTLIDEKQKTMEKILNTDRQEYLDQQQDPEAREEKLEKIMSLVNEMEETNLGNLNQKKNSLFALKEELRNTEGEDNHHQDEDRFYSE